MLLPGLLVVRAPWTAVAPLSLAFWTLSAWWPPFTDHGRGRFVVAGLAAFLLLALLRLVPKHEVSPPAGWPLPPVPPREPRPGLAPPALGPWPSRLVLAAALGLLLPVPLWHNAPGQRLAFQTTSARLFAWHDGIPANAEPLLPLEPMGAHAPALATLIADLSTTTGLDPGGSALWVVAGAAALVLVGLYAVQATWARPAAAALGALVGLALPAWPGFLAPWGDAEALLALAFLLPAAALAAGHASRSSAAAAALLLGAGALAQPALAGLTSLLLVALAASAPAARRRRRFARAAWVLGLALLVAAPGLWPLVRTLSAREAGDLLASSRAGELFEFGFAVLCAALAPLAFGRPGRIGGSQGRVARASVALAAAVLLLLRLHGWLAAGQLSATSRAALLHASRRVAPLASVCAAEGVRDFVPALAGRPAGEPGVWVPPAYSEEWARRERRPCDVQLEGSPGAR